MGNGSRSTQSDIDISSIKGNISDDLKRWGQAAWDFFVSTEDKSYGANIGKRLKFVEMNIWGEKGLSYAETVCLITIDKGMLHPCYTTTKSEFFPCWNLFIQIYATFLKHSMGLVQRILWISMLVLWIYDPLKQNACSCSVSSLVLMGASLGLDGGGVSQSMNLIWHNPIKMRV